MLARGNIEGLARIHDEIHAIITSARERITGENHGTDEGEEVKGA
jgi:hypothetical protein